MVDYSEKRDFQRMTVESSLEYHKDNDSEVHQGTVKNLSATGILFTTDDKLPLGIELSIKLTPINSITPPLSARVKVTRADKHADGDYYIACEIVKID